MFAPAYMGRKRFVQMLLLHSVTINLGQEYKKRSKGLRPGLFGPRTLVRTWGTRPGVELCGTP